MKTWEAMEALEEGKKVRKVCWNKDEYIVKITDGRFEMSEGGFYVFMIERQSDDWEVYDERKEPPLAWRMVYKKVMEAEGFLGIPTCEQAECHNCPYAHACDLFYDLYNELDEINRKYKLDKKHELEE